jgi:DNA polymerase I-like protein with 3'-5' exonuclease and polymerase domains
MSQGELLLMGGKHTPPIFKEVTWRPTPLIDLPHFRDAKRIGFDLETKDPDLADLGPGVRRPGARVVGFSYAIDGGPAAYVPFAHGCVGGEQDDGRDGACDNVEGNAIGWLTDEFANFDGDVVGANLPYDLDWSWELGVKMPKAKFLDVQVAQPLIYELEMSYSLESICEYNNIPGKDERLLREAAHQYGIDPKKDMWRMPGRMVGPYAEVDAIKPLELMRLQEERIAENELGECWALECRVLPMLVRLTRKGVRVDQDRLAQVEEWTKRCELKCYDIIKRETGILIPLGHSNNVDLLSQVLKKAGIPLGTTASGKDSVAKDVFAGIDHPVAKALSRARQVATIRTTFVNGLRRHLTPDSRIHCSFNQIRKTDDDTGESKGVAYGRLSASHVNMQNQPGNSRFSGDNELGPMWRSIYLAEEGELWDSNDLKQQEPKWSFHYGAILEERGISGAKGAIALCQRLTENPQLDTYEPIVELAGVTRPQAKVIWLARAYGKGDGGLCEDLGLPTADVTFSRKIYYKLLDEGVSKYVAKSIATVPVDSPEGQEALAGGRGLTWKGAGVEGKRILDGFEKEMPFLKVAAGLAKDMAEERGYVKLLSGRRCHFEKSRGGGKSRYEWTHKAFNRVIQGTSAEQTKRIMLALEDAGYGDRMMLQVHDEVASSVESEEQARAMAEVMRHAVPMKMPTVVDVECGPSWGESMGVEYIGADGKKAKVRYEWGMRIVDGTPGYFENPLSDVRVR